MVDWALKPIIYLSMHVCVTEFMCECACACVSVHVHHVCECLCESVCVLSVYVCASVSVWVGVRMSSCV